MKTTVQGFTLMEMMIVIAIIGVLSSIAVSIVTDPEHRIKKVARTLYADMEKTKMIAVKDNTSCRLFFGADGYTIQDNDGNVLKTVDFDDIAEGVTYGTGDATIAATVGATPGNPALPADGITYGGVPPRVTFNSLGTGGAGFVYLEHRGVVYAIGTRSTGLTRILRWTDGAWQ